MLASVGSWWVVVVNKEQNFDFFFSILLFAQLCSHHQHRGMASSGELTDVLGEELGLFEFGDDEPVSTARADRIAAARAASISYKAKIEEPGVSPPLLPNILHKLIRSMTVVSIPTAYGLLS